MTRLRGFRLAGIAALVAWIGTTLAALTLAVLGTLSLTGVAKDFTWDVQLVPGTDLVHFSYAPVWEVRSGGPVCQEIDVRDYRNDCYGFVLSHGEEREVGSVVTQGEVRPVGADLAGPLTLNTDGGWNPLMASLYAMSFLGLLVLSFTLYQVWRLLRTASRDEPFTDEAVRRLRAMGLVLLLWELAEPVLWLFLSPKALDYSEASYGPGPSIQLGSMEPGGPNPVVIAFALLLLLLAQVFRRGHALATEQRLTV